MNTLSYPYKLKPWTMLLAVLFFGACFVISWYVVNTNHEPLVVLGISLSPLQAKLLIRSER
jgi:hypothetical protein